MSFVITPHKSQKASVVRQSSPLLYPFLLTYFFPSSFRAIFPASERIFCQPLSFFSLGKYAGRHWEADNLIWPKYGGLKRLFVAKVSKKKKKNEKKAAKSRAQSEICAFFWRDGWRIHVVPICWKNYLNTAHTPFSNALSAVKNDANKNKRPMKNITIFGSRWAIKKV